MSKKLVDRGVCFCCQKPLTSATVGEDKFTKEHYLPQWLFRRHGLRQQTMELPSRSEIAYGHLWVPCCAGCNARLNAEIEERARFLITSEPLSSWAEPDRQIIKRWLAKVYLGVRVRASTLRTDQEDPVSPTIADQQEIDDAKLLRMVVGGHVTVPRSSLFVYECDPTDGDGFDFAAFDNSTIVMLRSRSVGLVSMLLDGEHIENGLTPAHPLIDTMTVGPLNAVSFRMVGSYAMAAAAAADVHHVMLTVNVEDQPKPLLVRFTPHWTDGPTMKQIQATATALAATMGVDMEWIAGRPRMRSDED